MSPFRPPDWRGGRAATRLNAMSLRLLFALLLVPLIARAAYPSFSSTKPNGGQVGTELKLTLAGTRLSDFEDLMFYQPGFKIKSVESRADGKVELTLAIDKSVEPGNYMVRIRTKSGLSHPRQFFVSPFPNVEEKEPNSEFAKAQPIELNQTIEGVVGNEDVDYFKLEVKKGQRISVEIEGLRLGYAFFDPYIAIIDKDKFEKAFSDDTILHRHDGYCSFVAEYDGTYYVMVRESSYRGSGQYRLHVGSFPRPDVIYPAGGKLGSKLTVSFVDVKESLTEEVQLPSVPNPNFTLYAKSQPSAPSGNPFRLATFDNTLEVEPNDTPETATVAEPAEAFALNGIIGKPGDVDYFKVPLKKGQAFDCNCFAQALGSPLDPTVSVITPKGAQLAFNDDGGGMRRLDSRFKFTAPADGLYTIKIADQLERGGPNFVYRLEMIAAQPSLTFASPEYTVNDSNYRQFLAVPRGGRMALLENFTRNGVKGDYRFEIKNLPPGLRLLNDAAPGDMRGMPLVLEATADAPIGGAIVAPQLIPLDPNNTTVGTVRQFYVIVGSGNTIYYQGVDDKLAVAVVDEAPYTLEIEKPQVPLVRDGTYNMKVVAKRKEGFKGPIRVFMIWTPPGFSLLPEQTIAAESDSTNFELSVGAGVDTKAWKFVVMGEADAGNGRIYNASPFAELTTESPFVVASAIPLTAMEIGKPGFMVTNFEVHRPFEGEATATLVGVPDTISIPPIKVTKDTKELRFAVITTDKSPLGKKDNLFVQIEVPTGKGTATHRVAIGSILRLDAPRKAAAAPVAKASDPATNKTAAVAPVEQLRKKNDSPKN